MAQTSQAWVGINRSGSELLAMDQFPGLDPYGMLVKDDHAFLTGCRVQLRCISVQSDHVVAETCAVTVPKMDVKCVVPTWTHHYFEEDCIFTLVNFRLDMDEGRATVKQRNDDEPILPLFHHKEGSVNVMDAYAGIGGWSLGSKLCGNDPVLLIEQDVCTAEACARNLDIPLLTIQDAFECVKQRCLPPRMVLVADVNAVHTMFFAGLFDIAWWLMSPPCQPWSRAGQQMGLATADGKAFARSVLNAAMMGVEGCNIENVPGLPDHPHFCILKDILRLVGWNIAQMSIDKVLPLAPVVRNRWLCTIVRDVVHILMTTNERLLTIHASQMTFLV